MATVDAAVRGHCGEAEAHDDATMVVVRVRLPQFAPEPYLETRRFCVHAKQVQQHTVVNSRLQQSLAAVPFRAEMD